MSPLEELKEDLCATIRAENRDFIPSANMAARYKAQLAAVEQLERDLEEVTEEREYWKRRDAERQKEIGMQEYRGNTVSYIYDKERSYSAKFAEINAKSEQLERENAELRKRLEEAREVIGPFASKENGPDDGWPDEWETHVNCYAGEIRRAREWAQRNGGEA